MTSWRLAALAAAAATAAGCSSQWLAGMRREDIALTYVTVRTTPPGADVFFDDRRQSATTPIRIPVEYTHAVTLYERQNNYGSRMREGMSPVVTVLTFPVWAVASFFHYHEEMQRHEYGNNAHTVLVTLPGYEDGRQTMKLEGEADWPVEFTLRREK